MEIRVNEDEVEAAKLQWWKRWVPPPPHYVPPTPQESAIFLGGYKAGVAAERARIAKTRTKATRTPKSKSAARKRK